MPEKPPVAVTIVPTDRVKYTPTDWLVFCALTIGASTIAIGLPTLIEVNKSIAMTNLDTAPVDVSVNYYVTAAAIVYLVGAVRRFVIRRMERYQGKTLIDPKWLP